MGDQIELWYKRAQVDYIEQYVSLYTAFNVWYSRVTHSTNDRQALNRLRRGNEIWKEYCNGTALHEMRAHMQLLVEYTQREPLSYASPHWRGEIEHTEDWASLLEYWYRVRCLVVHGSEIRASYVHLAYITLNIFMGKIITQRQLNENCLQPL